MMGIKRGVSLYSYQQKEWFREMTWKDQLREVATNLDGAKGIEIINECTIPHYPMPSESFFFDWNNEMARWGLVPVTIDTYLDTLQFRDHVMTHAETAERIKYDLRIAKKMGFKHMRLCGGTPHDSIEMALPLAEELDVIMTMEIHAPASIIPTLEQVKGISGWRHPASVVSLIKKHNTKHIRLQPDMGIFQKRPSVIGIASQLRRSGMSFEQSYDVAHEMAAECDKVGVTAFVSEVLPSKFPNFKGNPRSWRGCSANPEDLFSVIEYIACIHGKFYLMEEIPGKPGQYEDPAILYAEAINVLKNAGWCGYINSEYEGQRSQQDVEKEHLIDEIDQVRKQHEMLKRLIG